MNIRKVIILVIGLTGYCHALTTSVRQATPLARQAAQATRMASMSQAARTLSSRPAAVAGIRRTAAQPSLLAPHRQSITSKYTYGIKKYDQATEEDYLDVPETYTKLIATYPPYWKNLEAEDWHKSKQARWELFLRSKAVFASAPIRTQQRALKKILKECNQDINYFEKALLIKDLEDRNPRLKEAIKIRLEEIKQERSWYQDWLNEVNQVPGHLKGLQTNWAPAHFERLKKNDPYFAGWELMLKKFGY